MDKVKGKNSVLAGKQKKSPTLSRVSSIFLQCKSSLKRYVSSYISEPHDIEDIVNETFLRTYEKESDTHIESPKAYLYRAARNLALKHVTTSSYRLTDYLEDLELPEVSSNEELSENQIESDEQFQFLCKAVENLPLQCRRVFILRKVYGMSQKEVASYLSISVSTVEKHVALGISRCADFMKGRGYFTKQDKVPSVYKTMKRSTREKKNG
ncbi:sigma-70 family RNA polymerase sigma factor [Gammaproteobacteria bacterium]|nr:sigma-70 family RNA polymerase sigma factor [Gammaproteobacteria bacterium]